MYSWSIFLMSIGSIIILMSTPMEKGWTQIILGILMLMLGVFMFVKKRKRD